MSIMLSSQPGAICSPIGFVVAPSAVENPDGGGVRRMNVKNKIGVYAIVGACLPVATVWTYLLVQIFIGTRITLIERIYTDKL